MNIWPVGAMLFNGEGQQTDRRDGANSCFLQFCKCA